MEEESPVTAAMEWLEQMNWNWKRADTYAINTEQFRIRDKFIAKFGFAILTDEVVQAILPFSPFVEVGAGSGYWSHELMKAGAQSVATDPQTGKYGFGENRNTWDHWKSSQYVPIEVIDGITAVEKYPGHTLLTVWPDMAAWPAETLSRYKGSTVIYVGEGGEGCTADKEFHRILEEQFESTMDIAIPQFWGVHDYLSIWSRK
jgi:hypothetical protein